MAEPTSPRTNWPAFARSVIEFAANGKDIRCVPEPHHDLTSHGGVFVTLKMHGRLRGCMGTLDASQAVAEAVRHAACVAASQDPRFPALTPAELPDVSVEVSILGPPQPIQSLDDLVLGKHGILVRNGPRRGLFLPQVAVEHNLDKQTFLSRCCSEKAGLAPNAWEDPNTEVLIFCADVFSE